MSADMDPNGGSHTFVVPALMAGAIVRARQDAGAGVTPWSPDVVVEAVAVPPQAALPEEVSVCNHCILVEGLVPGCKVELLVGRDVVGRGVASNHGAS